MEKLGVTLDAETQGFRLAKESEPEFNVHAQAILADKPSRAEFEASTGIAVSSSEVTPKVVVDWFRARPANKAALVRLAQQ